MIGNEHDAICAARAFLAKAEIAVQKKERVKKISGAIRNEYVPTMANDFWMITFHRSTSILPSCSGSNDEEREIIAAVAEENSTITVAVEDDGTVTVI